MKIRIEYCTPCGFLALAIGLAEQILGAYKDQVKSLEIMPGSGGIFDVSLNGEVIYSRSLTSQFPTWEDIDGKLKSA